MGQKIAKGEPAAHGMLATALAIATWFGVAVMTFGFGSWLGAVLARIAHSDWVQMVAR
jgi:hypothetical protein